jgi:MraZ protein
MFQGHSICTLDAKSRLILPAKFRKYIKPEADNKLIITRGMDECLLLYPLDEWEKVKTALSVHNPFNSEQRNFIRQFLMYVNEVELDAQNRLLIPQQLLDFAKLNKEVMVLGLLDKMEIWNPEIKQKYDSAQTQSYEEIAEKVSELIRVNSGSNLS